MNFKQIRQQGAKKEAALNKGDMPKDMAQKASNPSFTKGTTGSDISVFGNQKGNYTDPINKALRSKGGPN